MGCFDPVLDGTYPIDKYREYYTKNYNKQTGKNVKVPSRKEGGIIKYQQGGYTFVYDIPNDPNIRNDELEDNSTNVSDN